ncbi:MAG TPA: MarR family transcriptional regulator [Dermatophilaceae bacterium]|nr:MarR family transcriptional regulator [Dermatophilaceae bacterium]
MDQPNPAVLMFIAYRHCETRILDHLARGGFNDITLAQGRVAARISEDGARLTDLAEAAQLTDLAEAAQLTKQTAGVLVDHLERAGYVERRPDPADARARLICLAERGRAAQARAREMELIIDAEWERRLGRGRMRELRRALADIREITHPFITGARGREKALSRSQKRPGKETR